MSTAGEAMPRELEAAAIDSVPAVLARAPTHPLPIGAPCPNCSAALAGPWCQACGQSSDDFHRSLVKLTAETLEGLFELDGRLWRTLPDLVLRPARLTRRYLDGQRVAQIPPFRLFLIVVVLVFLAAGLGPPRKPVVDFGGGPSAPGRPVVDLGDEPGAKDEGLHLNLQSSSNPRDQWLAARLKTAAKNPVQFESLLTEWAQRLAVLALPMSAALLGLMFFWRRGVYMFDHLIFSMHSLSFQGLLVAVVMAGSQLSGWFGWLLAIAPVHLFAHMKGTYGLGVFGTLARMLVLFAGSVLGFALALVGLVLIGLVEIGQ